MLPEEASFSLFNRADGVRNLFKKIKPPLKPVRQPMKSQTNNPDELYRFAEFGRISSTLIHDLANPVTAISINLEELERGNKSLYVKQMREGVNYLDRCINSARLQLNNRTQSEFFDSKGALEKVISLLKPKANQNQVRIKYKLAKNVDLHGDVPKFEQIFSNLICNAIDACRNLSVKTGREVKILSFVEPKCDYLVVCVRDSGVGIANKDIKNVFKPFYTTKSSEEGTGLGLAITKRIVEEDFGGKIGVRSDKSSTTFMISLPIESKMRYIKRQ